MRPPCRGRFQVFLLLAWYGSVLVWSDENFCTFSKTARFFSVSRDTPGFRGKSVGL